MIKIDQKKFYKAVIRKLEYQILIFEQEIAIIDNAEANHSFNMLFPIEDRKHYNQWNYQLLQQKDLLNSFKKALDELN